MLLQQSPCSLALPALFWVMGIAVAANTTIPFFWIALFIIILLALTIFNRYSLILVLLSLIAMGYMRYWISDQSPDNHLEKILAKYHRIEATASGIIKRINSEGYNTGIYEFEITSLAGQEAAGRIYLEAEKGLNPGSGIKGKFKLERIESARNPGQRDRRFSYHVRGISGFGKAIGKLEIDQSIKPGIFDKLKHLIEQRLERRLGSTAGFAQAIITGRRSRLDWQEKAEIRRAGLSHLFAVSGLHVGIAAVIFYSLLMLAFPYKISRILILGLMIVYGMVCQWSASVSRAVLMLGLYTICRLSERPVNLNQILFATLFIITLITPRQLFSAGLQLSFAATFIIINLAGWLEEKLYLYRSKGIILAGKRLLQGLLLTSSVVVFIMPISLAGFGTYSANGLISVLPASILFGLLLPVAFSVLLLPWFWQPFAESFRFLHLLFDRWLEICAGLPFYWENVNFYSWQAIMIYLLALLAYIHWKKYKKIAALILILLIPLVAFFPKIRLEQPENLKITCFDCGQGDMSLIEIPGSKRVLIDTGPAGHSYGTVDSSLLPWLRARGVSELNYVVLTHAHDDHYGGLTGVLGALRVETLVYTDKFMTNLENETELIEKIYQENSKIIIVRDTLSINLGRVLISIIHPDRAYPGDNLNNCSIVLRVDYGEFSGLFTGDIEKEAEVWLLKKYENKLDCDFVKIPHHGSITSSTEEFINRVSPLIGFIPAGRNNRFKFPHQAVVDRYGFLGERLVNGAEEGALILETDGERVTCEVMFRDSLMIFSAKDKNIYQQNTLKALK